jgi:hypothetical protein
MGPGSLALWCPAAQEAQARGSLKLQSPDTISKIKRERWKILCLLSLLAGSIREAQASVPPESGRPRCPMDGTFSMGSGRTVLFGEPPPPASALGGSLLLSPQLLGSQKPRRDSLPSLPLPAEWKDPGALSVCGPAGLQGSKCHQVVGWLPARAPRVFGSCFLTWTSDCHLLECRAGS